jgi:hypothetical protein
MTDWRTFGRTGGKLLGVYQRLGSCFALPLRRLSHVLVKRECILLSTNRRERRVGTLSRRERALKKANASGLGS